MIGMSDRALTPHQRKTITGTQNRQRAKNDCGWPAPPTCALHKPTPRAQGEPHKGGGGGKDESQTLSMPAGAASSRLEREGCTVQSQEYGCKTYIMSPSVDMSTWMEEISQGCTLDQEL